MSFSNWIKAFAVTVALCGPFALVPMQPAQAQDSTQAAATQPQLLSDEELETLVARIALYPDDLVAVVLAGSLYPLQIVQADRYLKENRQELKATIVAIEDGFYQPEIKSRLAELDLREALT